MTPKSAVYRNLDPRDLPRHLSERVRVIRHAPVTPTGEFVLYWMHHAVRSHENPALDTAFRVAHQLAVPVLVYQGLGGRHPYNSDRHHAFIMQGAREVQQALHRMGVTHLFHLGRHPSDKTPLTSLARRAVLIVTEDFPAPPFPQWTARLAEQAGSALWAVDAACIIPMQKISRVFDRAYAFRNHTREAYERRLAKTWRDTVYTGERFAGDCGFDPVDFENAAIPNLCALCDIDHTVPPVAHTPGGASSGYARWEAFKRHGLKQYDRLRNDAAVRFPRGVSRLSAYLHHGHVSPFRIAAEATRHGSRGAEKFIDELLIWRELAHHFCFHHRYPGTLAALPEWARRTLDEHSDDPRDHLYSWESLSRGRTGDTLWDAAQKSLLVHGELHNNVRMTWGKALLNWTGRPREALEMMIDLNHRYALDGNDANSYGGLLWCLGLFDRPFKPGRPVIGTLRPRSTGDHARRLDLAAYQAKIKSPASGRRLKVAVIGAGISGLFTARTLSDQGHQVELFEKSGQPGGRVATVVSGNCEYDTGTQYFTVRDDRFDRYVHSWQKDGLVKLWKGRLGVLKGGDFSPQRSPALRWVGVPGMQAVAYHLSADLDIRFHTKVVAANRNGKGWQLTDAGGHRSEVYDAIVTATPPPSAVDLVRQSAKLSDPMAGVEMQPCLAVMVAFEQYLDLPFDGVFVHGAPIRWACRNSSKPQRPAMECWVLHAGPEWSRQHADADTEKTTQLLIADFFTRVGCRPVEPFDAALRYWASALTANPLNAGCLWDDDLHIGVCGDWCQTPGVEGAALSGMAMAGRVMGITPGPRQMKGVQRDVWPR